MKSQARARRLKNEPETRPIRKPTYYYQDSLGYQERRGNDSTSLPSPSSSPWSRQKIRNDTPLSFSRLNIVANTSTSSGDLFLVIGGLGPRSWGNKCRQIFEATRDLSGEWSVDSFEACGPEPGCRVGHAGVKMGKHFVMIGGRTESSNAVEREDSSLYILHLREYFLLKFQDLILTKREESLEWENFTLPNEPPAHKGHSLNHVGQRIFMFGGRKCRSDGSDKTVTNDFFTLDLRDLVEWMEWMENKRAHKMGSEPYLGRYCTGRARQRAVYPTCSDKISPVQNPFPLASGSECYTLI